MTATTTRHRRQSERDTHEVYHYGEFIEGNLSKREAQQRKRSLARRERKRQHQFDR